MTNLKHKKGTMLNKNLIEQENVGVLRWSIWIQGFDFNIVYKVFKENSLVDILTREGTLSHDIKVFYKGESSQQVQARDRLQV